MLLLSLLPQVSSAPAGIGIEWMPVASVVVPFLLLITILLMGRTRV